MEISPEYRRLDSLARLLENNFTCAAVVRIGTTLYVTTNKSHMFSKASYEDRGDTKYLSRFMGHFSCIDGKHKFSEIFSSQTSSISNEIDLLKGFKTEAIDLLFENYKGKKASKYQGKETPDDLLPDDVLKEIIADLLDNTQYWNRVTDQNFFCQKFPKLFSNNKFLNMQYISGLYFAYNNLYRDVRDYKKVFHSFFSDGDGYFKDIQDIKLLCIGEKEEHAEMRLLGYLLSDEAGLIKYQEDGKLIAENEIYIGISKLCCGDCQRTLNAFNVLLSNKIVPLRASEKKEKNSEGGAEIMDENEMKQILQTRGTHDLVFTWPEPAFVRGEQYFANRSNSTSTCFCIKGSVVAKEDITAKNEENLLKFISEKLERKKIKIPKKEKINMISNLSDSPPLDEKPRSKSLDNANTNSSNNFFGNMLSSKKTNSTTNSKSVKKTQENNFN